jgi:hypothetical protein
MATYKQIQDYIKQYYGYCVKTCWIAHVKELNGLHLRGAPNRFSESKRKYPCPNNKRSIIENALKHYNMI